MSLSGALTTMPLPDLMQWLHLSRCTGQLALVFEFEECLLRLVEGNIVAVESDDARAQDVGQICLQAGVVSEADLRRAHELARGRRSISEVLVDDLGRLTRARLDELVTAAASERVLGLFVRREGRFHYSPTRASILRAESKRELRLLQPLDTRSVLMEGMRRLDEWHRITTVFPSDDCQIHALGHRAGLPILEELVRRGGPVTILELWAPRPLERFQIYEQLFQAYSEGLLAIDVRGIPMAGEGGPSPVDVLLQNGAALLDERQFEEAAAVIRGALNLDPFRSDARDLLHRAREEQLVDLYQTIPPYKVPVLRVTRERLAELGLSARELQVGTRINGRWDVGALALMMSFGELETLRALQKLTHIGAIALGD